MKPIEITTDDFVVRVRESGILILDFWASWVRSALMVFRDGILLLAQPGLAPAKALDEIVTKVLALDMDEVRSRVETMRGARVAPSPP